jgi:hypothetical protein
MNHYLMFYMHAFRMRTKFDIYVSINKVLMYYNENKTNTTLSEQFYNTTLSERF